MSNVIQLATGQKKNFQIHPGTALKYAEMISAGIADYFRRINATVAVIGNSGGLDSAVTIAACKKAGLQVLSVMMPYGDNMINSGSYVRAMEMVEKFDCVNAIVDIKPRCDAMWVDYDRELFDHRIKRVENERAVSLQLPNLMAQVRNLVLRDIARKVKGTLVVDTSNGTEFVLGYYTKDGIGGDLRPFKMCLKREMYMLAVTYGVVERIILAAPSAELMAGQTDEGEMGFLYREADEFILHGHCDNHDTEGRIANMIVSTQHKRSEPWFFNGS